MNLASKGRSPFRSFQRTSVYFSVRVSFSEITQLLCDLHHFIPCFLSLLLCNAWSDSKQSNFANHIHFKQTGMYRALIKTAPKLVSGAVVGGILGFLFYYFYGCNGTCLISSDPWTSTLYGSFVGMLFSRRFSSKEDKQ